MCQGYMVSSIILHRISSIYLMTETNEIHIVVRFRNLIAKHHQIVKDVETEIHYLEAFHEKQTIPMFRRLNETAKLC
uniref:Uncharacterized protein n=1 Tax=Romanomermis culicivorax TaxID=13658 RepID=A0A915HSK9_ROMCU